MRLFVLTALLAVLMMVQGCQTVVRDQLVFAAQEEDYKKIAELDMDLTGYFLYTNGKPSELRARAQALTNRPTASKDYTAGAYARLSESLYYEGRPGEAETVLKLIDKLGIHEEKAYWVRAMLTADSGRKRIILENGLKNAKSRGYLLLTLGLLDYGESRYPTAAARLDEALKILGPDYTARYGGIRDLSFRLAGKTTGNSAGLLSSTSLTIGDMVQYAGSETVFLRHILGDKPQPPAVSVAVLIKNGILPDGLDAGSPLTRATLARFAWNICAMMENNPGLLKAYSSIQDGRGVSPVPDVALFDPWYDAVLGCVERGIMELPDGAHFKPEGTVPGVELDAALRRLKKLYP